MTVFKHETVFDTAGRTMTFIVHKRLEIVINFKEYEILVIKDGKIIDRTNFIGRAIYYNRFRNGINASS